MKLEAARLSALSRLFSSTVFKEMAARGCSPLFARLASESFTSEEQSSLASVRDAFECAFSWLQSGANRDEYVYKAAITRRVLLGRHSLRSACMLNEFRVGQCKADLVILNGTATAYEIKSERDSLGRLHRQLQAYRTVFPKCYVIAGENHVDTVADSTPEEVGVLLLSSRQRISTVREATERLDLVQSAAVFDAIRTSEAVRLLERLGAPIPEIPNTRMRSELRKIFLGLSPTDFYAELLGVLKVTRDLSTLEQLISDLPTSLHAAALTVRLRRVEHGNLVAAVGANFNRALGWT